jgi:hypothetical protein
VVPQNGCDDGSACAAAVDAIVFSEALSEAAVKNQKLVAEKADLRARVGAMDMVNAAPTTPGDLKSQMLTQS